MTAASPRLSFIHLSGTRRGAVDDIDLPATLGSGPGASVRVPGAAARHAVVFRRDGDVVLQDAGSRQGTFVAESAVRELNLRDGDVIELGRGGPKLRFRCEGERQVSLLQALAWARPEGVPGLADSAAFLRAMARETGARTSRTIRLLLVAAGVLLITVMGWSQWEARRLRAEVHRLREAVRLADLEQRHFYERIERERERAETDRRALVARLEEFRRREEELNRRLADDAAAGEVQALREDLAETRQRIATLESERAVGERIIHEYGPGVCLIQGRYAFVDAKGRGLRYRLDKRGRREKGEDGEYLLGVSAGPIYTVEYFATGFLVDRQGRILTNRHVAEHWGADSAAQSLIQKGFWPRFLVFRAFFPGEREPFALTIERLAQNVDASILRADTQGRSIPALPLQYKGVVPGQPAVLVAYPRGLDAIVAKADRVIVAQVLEAVGNNWDRLTEALSQRGLIRPSTTWGDISDVTPAGIVVNLLTAPGSSGGALFNMDGNVIGLKYSHLLASETTNYALSVNQLVPLLRPMPVGVRSPSDSGN